MDTLSTSMQKIEIGSGMHTTEECHMTPPAVWKIQNFGGMHRRGPHDAPGLLTASRTEDSAFRLAEVKRATCIELPK